MVLLDTTFLSDVIRQRPQALGLLEGMQERGERLATTTINLAELYAGVLRLPDPQDRLVAVERIVEVLVLVDFDARAAKTFGQLHAQLAAQGSAVPAKDLLVASAGLSHGEHEVLTRNRRDFERVPGIIVRSY